MQLRGEDKTRQAILTDKEMRKLLNGIVNNYEIFCWEDDYGFSDSVEETDMIFEEEKVCTESDGEDNPSWEVEINYLNGESQKMCGYDELPGRINELVLDLLTYFDEAEINNHRENTEN